MRENESLVEKILTLFVLDRFRLRRHTISSSCALAVFFTLLVQPNESQKSVQILQSTPWKSTRFSFAAAQMSFMVLSLNETRGAGCCLVPLGTTWGLLLVESARRRYTLMCMRAETQLAMFLKAPC